MTATTRKDKRADLATFLQTALTLVEDADIYDHVPKTFGGRSPVVYLKSAGSGQTPLSGNFMTEGLLLEIHSLAVYEDTSGDPPINNEDAQDFLDGVDVELRDCLDENFADKTKWQAIVQVGDSRVQPNAEVDGKTYLHEARVVRIYP